MTKRRSIRANADNWMVITQYLVASYGKATWDNLRKLIRKVASKTGTQPSRIQGKELEKYILNMIEAKGGEFPSAKEASELRH